MARNRLKKFGVFDFVCYLLVTLLSLIFLYPVVYALSIALSDPMGIREKAVMLWPVGFSLESFKYLLEKSEIWMYYKNSVIYTVLGTVIFLVATCMMAFPFTRKDFRGKTVLNVFMVITMFFGGGMIPTYYIINMLGLRNTIWVMVLPGCVSAYQVIVFRTFFQGLPDSLVEAAYIDGAGHYRVLWQIVIPLSKPLLATFALFTAVAKWNDWFAPLIYLNKEEMQTMQIYLRRMLIEDVVGQGKEMKYILEYQNRNPITIKYASVWLAILPIMCVYPFLQKYFAKGTVVGAIKG
ncbi:MAG: carbohydrate ABC transporter permease [Clostridiales bacterium]|nr:carbohydrate ABC transporter permease [Clostridiales bacterium]